MLLQRGLEPRPFRRSLGVFIGELGVFLNDLIYLFFYFDIFVILYKAYNIYNFKA